MEEATGDLLLLKILQNAEITALVMIDRMYKLLQERDYPAEKIFPLLIGLGHSRATILRAKTEMQIASVKRGRWYWHLPTDEDLELSEAL